MRQTKSIRSLLAASAIALLGFPPAASRAEKLVFLTLERRARGIEAARAVDTALQFQLTTYGDVARGEPVRDALRRRRLRDPDLAAPAVLRELAIEFEADWLVVATLHDELSYPVPDLSVSLRLYEGATGQLRWAGFAGRSGLDGRSVLGLGTVDTFDEVASDLIERLLRNAPVTPFAGNQRSQTSLSLTLPAPGSVALVPFTSYVDQDALVVAEAATEALRAILFRTDIELVPASCVGEALREQRAQVWGELTIEAREYLSDSCGANYLMTGSVEQWQNAGSGTEPEPEIALALRLLDSANGRILWMDSKEAAGWDHGSFFGLRRVFSRGVLLDKLLTALIQDLTRDDLASTGKTKR